MLKVKRTVKSSGKKQRDLLIAGSMAEGMKPVYCIYCTERQRTLWKEVQAVPGFKSFETGCLLAAAGDVPDTTTRLDEIEENCWPWHHLFAPEVEVQKELEAFAENVRKSAQTTWTSQLRRVPLFAVDEMAEAEDVSGWSAPTIQDLNDDTGREFDGTGVWDTTEEDLARLESGTSVGSEVAQSDGERLRRVGIRPDDGDRCSRRPGARRAPRTAGTLTTLGCALRGRTGGSTVRAVGYLQERAFRRDLPVPVLVPIGRQVVGHRGARQCGAGEADVCSGQDVHEVGCEVDRCAANRRQGFDAQAILQALWPPRRLA